MVNVGVTGGAGFIGSNFVRHAIATHSDWHVTTLDKLTYAGRLENLRGVLDHPRHTFVKGDIADPDISAALVKASEIVVHFAAETHVDRSLMSAGEFITTDVFGTFVLLESARQAARLRRFIQISTDEVYGSVAEGSSRETDELRPRNPYSASKAGADRLAYSYWATYNVPVVITRASNNYGPFHFPEKVIPLFITNAIDNIPLPLYGDGQQERDWLHVSDHCRAIDLLIDAGTSGEVYNVGGGNHVKNIDLTKQILQLAGRTESLIQPVADRPGHDRRYALDTSKLRQLGWRPQVPFDSGLRDTVTWYRENEWCGRPIKENDQALRAYYDAQDGRRVSPPAVPGSPLVTGATGFAGSPIVDHLLEDERHVAAWAHVRH